MRIQIVDLPSQHVGDVMTSPYLLVLSELRNDWPPAAAEHFRKDGFDHCAGVIATTERVVIGPESAHEMLQREERELRVAEANLGLPYGAIIRVSEGGPIIASTQCGRSDIIDTMTVGQVMTSLDVECSEQEKGRGCACALGAQDCPVNGKVPASIGVMDIAHETRAVSVTENEGGTRVAHIAIDTDQTPEELASDVAAIVEEQREGREYRQIGYCSCRTPGQYEATCGIPQHRDLAAIASLADVPSFD